MNPDKEYMRVSYTIIATFVSFKFYLNKRSYKNYFRN